MINKLIGKFGKKQLQELVFYLVSTSETAEANLLDCCQNKGADANIDNHTLIIENKVQRYWNKSAQIIEMFNMYGGDPKSDEDDAYEALEDMSKLLEENEVSWHVRKEILVQILGVVASDNCGFTDYLMDIAFIMCTNTAKINIML